MSFDKPNAAEAAMEAVCNIPGVSMMSDTCKDISRMAAERDAGKKSTMQQMGESMNTTGIGGGGNKFSKEAQTASMEKIKGINPSAANAINSRNEALKAAAE